MDGPFQNLIKRAQLLGNHHLKYTMAIQTFGAMLKERLEETNQLDKVHLFAPAHNLALEMDIITRVSKDHDEALKLVGCYYSIQFLLLNLRELDVLRKSLISEPGKTEKYIQFMLQMGKNFRSLTAAYMGTLIRLFRGHGDFRDFVIAGVGTRADQDDIDVGIIIVNKSIKMELNDVISKLSNEMMRRACCLHFHLSEHVAEGSYAATIPEYLELLDKEIRDFVIITEMLGAAPILGNLNIFKQFQRQVTQRYFYARGGDNKYHEGYLRGLLGELRSLLIQQLPSNVIHPKNDVLRLIKGFFAVGKTVFNIQQVNAWQILDELMARDPSRMEVYKNLYHSLTFVEIFRYLYQLFIVQEEEIFLTDEIVYDNLTVIAENMGYGDIGVIKSWENLLVHYYEYVKLAKESAGILLDDVRRQLSFISPFPKLLNRVIENQDTEFNLNLEFTRESRFYRGTKFWDDVLEIIKDNQDVIIQRFIRDILELDGHARLQIMKSYARCGQYTMYSLMSFNIMLGHYREKHDDHGLFHEFNDIFLAMLHDAPNVSQRLTRIFNYYPKLVHDYLVLLCDKHQKQFAELLKHEMFNPEMMELRDKLLHYVWLHHSTSRFFVRYFYKLAEEFPEYITFISEATKLQEIASGMLAEIDDVESFENKKHMLGNYYNTEFLRIGIETLRGVDCRQTNLQFTEFSDNYLKTLIDICKHEVDAEIQTEKGTEDLLAIYATGGHAREQAFNDDYDLIFLLNTDSEDLMNYCIRIISKMNSELIKQGVLPHYRFADHFGNYITRVNELENFFASDDPALFIDKSQVLGSRLVVGSEHFERDFEKRIIEPYIFNMSGEYTSQMIEEIYSRHQKEIDEDDDCFSLKECKGGLRDIEMLLLMYKANLRIRLHISDQFMKILLNIIPQHQEQITVLDDNFHFLKKIRDVYRLVESAGDDLCLSTARNTALILGFNGNNHMTAEEELFETINVRTQLTWQTIEKLLDHIRK